MDEIQLDERKGSILKAVIDTYLKTGEPVGSRTISKFSDLHVSSATIRNEMVDLEEMGLLTQPHTSAGRIPTDLGYRYYVDHLIMEREQESREHELLIQKVDRMEVLMQQLAKLLAQNTQYTAMIAGPHLGKKLKYVQLSQAEPGKLMVVVVVEGNLIRNFMLPESEDLTPEELLGLNIMINSTLNGLSISEINLGVINELKNQAGKYRDVMEDVLSVIGEAIRSEEGEQPVFTSGATNIFKYPELSDGEKASGILTALEEQEQLVTALSTAVNTEKANGISVYIGSENRIESMKDCSLVTANYDFGEGMIGTIGVIGPKRMDYEKVVATLMGLIEQLNKMYH
ncbi:MAG: heat-inducible transcription repressor HrcA [Lachnospiraceae bacterium]|nr:heat-inducible transcription repressor HrcA [Lachnospiraceae bacterium]